MKIINTKNFDRPISTICRKNTIGDFGVELELEGKNLSLEDLSQYWVQHNEPSLRDGVEWVLVRPLSLSGLRSALKEFELLTPKKKIKQSIRTSTHIHINVLKLTLKELYNVLGHYFLVEDLLVALNGEHRLGNLFCLRASDAFGCINACIEGIRSGGLPRGDNNTLKYGAVNLITPQRYGSLEFRFMRGADSTDFVEFWAENLYELVHMNSRRDIRETIDTVDYHNLVGLAQKILPLSLFKAVQDHFTPNHIERELRFAIKRVTCITTAMDTEVFTKPTVYLENEDQDTRNILSKDLKFLKKDEPKVARAKPLKPLFEDEPFVDAENIFSDEET